MDEFWLIKAALIYILLVPAAAVLSGLARKYRPAGRMKISAVLQNADEAFGKAVSPGTLPAYLKEQRFLIGYLLLLAVLSFAYELFNFSLTLDEEVHAQYPSAFGRGWMGEGRWGMALLHFGLFHNPVFPFVPLFTGLVFSAAAYFVIIHLWSGQRTRADYFAAPFFISCPVLYYIYSFNTLSYGIGIGFFSAALSVFLFSRAKGIGRLRAVFPLAFAAGIYQAFVLWSAALFLLHLLSKAVNRSGKRIGWYGAESLYFFIVLLLALALYFAVNRAAMSYFGIGVSGYLANYVKVDWSPDYLSAVFGKVLRSMQLYYSGGAKVYGMRLSALAPVFLLSFAALVLGLLRSRQGAAVVLFCFAALAAALFVPFGLSFINAGDMPVRTFLAVPLVLSGLVFLAFSVRSAALRFFLAAGVIACSFQFIVLNQRLAFSDYLTWQADREFALRLQIAADSIAGELPEKGPQEKWPLEIVGSHHWKKTHLFIGNETIGASFFEWDQGNARRAAAFMESMGLADYRLSSLEERRSVMDAAGQMPEWPGKGSVGVINGILVIKLSDYSDKQRYDLCRDKSVSNSVCNKRPAS